jgi:hypothetical protein
MFRRGRATVSKPLERGLWCAAILFALAPVLLVPSAATNDGPSHLYNAWVASRVESGAPGAVGAAFEVDRSLGQTLLSATMLQWLGPRIGWNLAERLWVGFVLVGLLGAVAWYVHRSGATSTNLVPLLLAWLPLSLVTAWGFYDFLLGAGVFAVLLGTLEEGSRPRIGLLLALLFLIHLFVFVMALGVVGVRALSRKDLRVPVILGAVFGAALVLGSGVLESELALNFDLGQRLVQLAASSVLYSVTPAAAVAGLAWTALLAYGLTRSPREWRSLVGLALLIGALIVPTNIGGGSILFERVHLLALIALAPVVADSAARLPRAAALPLALLLAGGLSLTFSQWTSTGRDLDADREEIASLLQEANVATGNGWVGSGLPDGEWKVYRAPFHAHLVDRVALEFGLTAVDNYEAGIRPFPVRWTHGRQTIHIRSVGDVVQVYGTPAEAVYVVHPAAARLDDAVEPVARGARFAVSILPGPAGEL